jgi:hypothetical protein
MNSVSGYRCWMEPCVTRVEAEGLSAEPADSHTDALSHASFCSVVVGNLGNGFRAACAVGQTHYSRLLRAGRLGAQGVRGNWEPAGTLGDCLAVITT